MAIFCENCGTPNSEESILCTSCSAALNKEPIPDSPAAPTRDNPWAAAFRQNIKLIIAVVSVLALMIGIMNLFGTYEVNASASFLGQKATESAPLYEIREDAPDEIMLYIISAFVLGIACLGAAGLGGYSLYLLLNDKAGSRKFFSLSILVGLAGSLLAILLAIIGCRITYWGVTMSFGIHITYWLTAILYGALLCADKLLLKDNCAPLK